MSFFKTSTGQAVESTGTFESGGGNLAPIPDGTQVLAAVDEAKWDAYQGEDYVSLRWSVMQPAEYANRKIFQKIKVADKDATKRDKALAMLAAIDTNAGGKLQAAGRKPTDQDLAGALMNRPMVLKLGVWELDDKSKSGNWIQKVAPRKGGNPAPAPAPAPAPKAPTGYSDMDDDIPFMRAGPGAQWRVI